MTIKNYDSKLTSLVKSLDKSISHYRDKYGDDGQASVFNINDGQKIEALLKIMQSQIINAWRTLQRIERLSK